MPTRLLVAALESGLAPEDRCSRFYHQTPAGAGTGLHESLPSYIDRLAERHGVAPGLFFHTNVRPAEVLSRGSPLFARHSRGLLLGGGHADRVAKVVAAGAAEPAVTALVQPQLSRQIGWYKDTRRHAAWCPTCLAEWLSAGSVVYRPLLWSLQSVLRCPTHSTALIDRCPECSGSFYHLSKQHWSPFCPRCGHLLLSNGPPKQAKSEPPTNYDLFAATHVVDLLKWGLASRAADFPEGCFTDNIERALSELGGEYVMSERVGLTRPAIHAWRRGHRRPTLPALIRLSYCFDVPLHHWVAKSIPSSMLSKPRRSPVSCSLLYRRHPAKRNVRKAVKAYLSRPQKTPLSLSGLAKTIGTSTYKIYRTCPDLAANVVTMHSSYRGKLKKKRQVERVRLVREAIAELSREGLPVTRNAVVTLLTERGVKCSWLLKEIFRREVERVG